MKEGLNVFFVSVEQVVIMFLLMILGLLCSQIGFIHKQTAKDMTNLLLYIVSPVLIINSFLRKFSWARLTMFGLEFFCVLLVFILGIIIANLIFSSKLIKQPVKRNALRFSLVYSNCGFVGIPLIQAIVGNGGVFYSVPYLILQNIFIWTHGAAMYQGKVKKSQTQMLKSALLNPNIIASIVGLIIFIAQIPLPEVLTTTFDYITALNMPLSMIIIGTNLSQLDLKNSWQDMLAWVAVLVRNLLFPIVVILFLQLFGLNHEALMATIIMVSCPIASLVVLFSLLNDLELEFPTKIMCLSTLLSVVTIPVLILFTGLL